MDIIEPKRDTFLLPAGARETVYLSPDPNVQPLPALHTPDGKCASQWMPTPGELALLNQGVPVTLVVWTFNKKLLPVSIGVGGMDLR
jgi:hypothetical protein